MLIANVNVEHDTRKFLPRTWLSPFFPPLSTNAVYLTFSHTHIRLDINKDDNVACESKVNWSRHLRLPHFSSFSHIFFSSLSPLWFIVRFTSMIFTPAKWLNIFLFTSSPDLKSHLTYNYERSSSQRGDDARLFVRTSTFALKGRTQLTIINCKIYTSLVAASWLEGFEAKEQVSSSSSSIQRPKNSHNFNPRTFFFSVIADCWCSDVVEWIDETQKERRKGHQVLTIKEEQRTEDGVIAKRAKKKKEKCFSRQNKKEIAKRIKALENINASMDRWLALELWRALFSQSQLWGLLRSEIKEVVKHEKSSVIFGSIVGTKHEAKFASHD